VTNDPRIEALLNRLPELDEEERALKIESSACAFPQMTDSGAVEMIISDASRLAEIREEMAAIGRERKAINAKLTQLRELLGDEMYIGGTASDEGYLGRLRSDFATRFLNKVLKEHNPTLTPAEGLESEAYAKLRSEFQPQIEAVEARIKAAEEKQLAVAAILNT